MDVRHLPSTRFPRRNEEDDWHLRTDFHGKTVGKHSCWFHCSCQITSAATNPLCLSAHLSNPAQPTGGGSRRRGRNRSILHISSPRKSFFSPLFFFFLYLGIAIQFLIDYETQNVSMRRRGAINNTEKREKNPSYISVERERERERFIFAYLKIRLPAAFYEVLFTSFSLPIPLENYKWSAFYIPFFPPSYSYIQRACSASALS